MKRMDTINVIPFIDIMLVLLAIVLTTATFIVEGRLNIRLPKAEAQARAESMDRVEIGVGREGELYLDAAPVELEPLAGAPLRPGPSDRHRPAGGCPGPIRALRHRGGSAQGPWARPPDHPDTRVTNPTRCRDCAGLAVIGSAAIHGVLAAALWWAATSLAPAQAPADSGGQEVAVTLAMFGGSNRATGQLTPAAAPVVEPTEVEPVPEPVMSTPPEPLPEPLPEPDPEPNRAPVVQPEPPPLLLAESPPKPKVKPKPPPMPPPTAKPKPKRPAPEVIPVAAQPRAAPARVQPVAAKGSEAAGTPAVAAPGLTAGTGDAASPAAQEGAYLKGLTQAIARNRFYPPEAQRQDLTGVVVVAFTIRADGSLTEFRVAKGSGSEVIDQAAVETVRRLGTYKPIPAGIGRSQWPVKVPIRFDLR